MNKIRNYSLLIACMLFLSMANAQKVNSFTVQQATDYAKKNSVQVKNALLDVLIQKQTNRDVTSIALPQINGSMSLTRNVDIPVQTIPNFIGPATYKVLIEGNSKKDENFWMGRNSQNKVIVFPKEDYDLQKADYVMVKVNDCTKGTLLGTIVK